MWISTGQFIISLGIETKSYNCSTLHRIIMDYKNDDPHRRRTIPVCFNQDKLKIIEGYAKKKAMLNYSQAIELLAKRMCEK